MRSFLRVGSIVVASPRRVEAVVNREIPARNAGTEWDRRLAGNMSGS